MDDVLFMKWTLEVATQEYSGDIVSLRGEIDG